MVTDVTTRSERKWVLHYLSCTCHFVILYFIPEHHIQQTLAKQQEHCQHAQVKPYSVCAILDAQIFEETYRVLVVAIDLITVQRCSVEPRENKDRMLAEIL